MVDDETLSQDATALERALELSRDADDKPAPVPGFTVLRCLGEGAYGAVWLAREENTGKQVAIKFYTHHRGLDWSLLNREVEKLAVLYTSRNIVRLLGVGWESDPPYYVMEYLENGSLASFLADGPIPAHEAVRIAKSVSQALVHAHGSGILHCDLKPANVLLDADYEPRICDFGQSRLSNEQNPSLGTLFYMAPEQADLSAIPDARWDVYALGALLYHMLVGHAPYWTQEHETQIRSAETLEERLAIYRRILKRSPVPTEHRKLPGVDKRLVEVIDRCLRVDPQKRFANAQAVMDTLELRDRQRARRPLVALGVIGPGLLLLAMAFIVRNVLSKSVDDARTTLVERAIESNVQPARILADSLKPRLVEQKSDLVQLADLPHFRATIRGSAGLTWDERKSLFNGLEVAKLEIDEERKGLNRPVDVSWFVTDARGKQLWRHPYNEKTIDKIWSFRDYFHGLRREYTRESVPENIEPIREPHVSMAFRSRATGQLMVAVSVPVWDDEHQQVIGVLARTTNLGDLLQGYGEELRVQVGDEVERVVALIQCADGRLLNHPWMTPERMKSLPDEIIQKLAVDESLAEQFKGLTTTGHELSEIRSDSYTDPVGSDEVDPELAYSGDWLAAIVLIEGSGWAAVVQERRDAALAPILRMKQEMIRYALGALVAGCALVGLLWYFVSRALNDRSVRNWARRGIASRPSEKGSTVFDRRIKGDGSTVTDR